MPDCPLNVLISCFVIPEHTSIQLVCASFIETDVTYLHFPFLCVEPGCLMIVVAVNTWCTHSEAFDKYIHSAGQSHAFV